MSKKDKVLMFILCILTSALLSIILTEIRLRVTYRSRIIDTYEYSKEAWKDIQQIQENFI